MTIETLIRRFYQDLWNNFDKTLIPILLSDKIVFQGVTQSEMIGHTAFANTIDMIQSSFPDLEHEIEELIVDPSRQSLFVWVTYTGTYRGDYSGLEKAGYRVRGKGAARFQTHQDQITNAWMRGYLKDLMPRLGTKD